MSRRHVLVCAGFFPDRHAALLAELGRHFEIRYLDPEGRDRSRFALPLAARGTDP